MNTPSTEMMERFTEFFDSHYDEAIDDLAQRYPDRQRSLSIDYETLERFDADLADNYLIKPGKMREHAEEALRLYDIESDTSLGRAHVRINNLPTTTSLAAIRTKHLHQLIQVRGTVSSTSTVRSEFTNIAYECQRCGTSTHIPQPTVRRSSDRQEPSQCQGCERNGPFRIHYGQSEMIDVQTAVLEQRIRGIGGSDDSTTIELQLRDDIAGTVTPGESVLVTGILQHTDTTLKTTISDKFIAVTSITEVEPNSHITITVDDEERIQELAACDSLFEDIIGSIAPALYGYDQAKLAVACQLVGGVLKTLPDGSRVRGDIHLLFVGDPGTGKSMLARAAARLAPRAVTVSGPETTSVGLTAAATPSSGNADPWEVKGGALVRANNGLAVIDNIDGFGAEELAGLHSTIEAQEVNVSKASVTTSLPARTTVLAAMNPETGRFDPYMSIGNQLILPSDVISQFDLPFILVDKPDSDRDEAVADHILDTSEAAETAKDGTASDSPAEPVIPLKLLQKYFVYAKRQSVPQLSDEAKDQLRDFYVRVRSEDPDSDVPIPVTARNLEAGVRLAEASARLRLSDTVTRADADRAITLIETCLHDMGVDVITNDPDDVQTTYAIDTSRIESSEFPQTKSEKDMWNSTKDILSEAETQYEYGIPKEKAINEIVEQIDVSKMIAEALIEKLRIHGMVYEPTDNHFRTA